MVLTFPMPETPCMDAWCGAPCLAQSFEAIAQGRGWTWRRAGKTERPGYAEAVLPEYDEAGERTVEGVAEVVPPVCYAFVAEGWELTAEEVAAIGAAVAAWVPDATKGPIVTSIARHTRRQVGLKALIAAIDDGIADPISVAKLAVQDARARG